MSVSNSQAKIATSPWDEILKEKNKITELYNLIRTLEGPKIGTRPISGTARGAVSQTGFLRQEDAVLMGIISYNPLVISLTSSKTIDMSVSAATAYASRLIIANSGGNVLETLDGASHAGQQLEIQGVLTESITIKHQVGNIRSVTGADITITGNQVVLLTFDSVANEWVIKTPPTGGSTSFIGFTADADLLMGTFDIKNVDRHLFAIDSGAFAASSDIGFVASTLGLNYQTQSLKKHRFLVNGVLGASVEAGFDAEGNSLFDLNDILFTGAGQLILSDSTGISSLVPTGQTFKWLIASALAMEIQLSDIVFHGRNLDDLDNISFDSAGAFFNPSAFQILYHHNLRHRFQISGVDELSIFPTGIDVEDNILDNVGLVQFNLTGQLILPTGAGLEYFVPTGGLFHDFIDGGISIFKIRPDRVELEPNAIVAFGGNAISLSATAGFQTLPAKPVAFINAKVGGASVRIPYFNP